MSKEIKQPLSDGRLDTFLNWHYPVDQNLVNKKIDDAMAHATKYLKASTYLWINIGFESERVGVENLPVMLAAARILEKDLPVEERKIPNEYYLELLMKGEIKSLALADKFNELDEMKLHVDKISKLLDILKDF